jgi:hypothetical protein
LAAAAGHPNRRLLDGVGVFNVFVIGLKQMIYDLVDHALTTSLYQPLGPPWSEEGFEIFSGCDVM